jgi:hypothetical protein
MHTFVRLLHAGVASDELRERFTYFQFINLVASMLVDECGDCVNERI